MPSGGVSGWQSELAGLNYAFLNQPNGIKYVAAQASPGKPNVFSIRPMTITTTPTLMTMFGTITTDGTVGPLTEANFTSWNIVCRTEDRQNFTEVTSTLINAVDVYSDNVTLTVLNHTGNLQIGIPMVNPRYGRPVIVTLGDFTNPDYPFGVVSYYYGWQGLVAYKAGLTHGASWVVGNK